MSKAKGGGKQPTYKTTTPKIIYMYMKATN